MRNLVRGAQFKRDVKLAVKRGKDMATVQGVLRLCGSSRSHGATLAEGRGNILRRGAKGK